MSEAADAKAAERQQRFIQRFMAGVPHLAALGIAYRAHGPDWAELEMPYKPELVGYPDAGTVASGAIYSLMDSCAGFSVFVTRGQFVPHATLDLRLDYLAVPAPGLTIVARATCYRLARAIAFVRGVAHTGDPDRPIASAAGTFMFTAPAAPAP